MLDIDDMLQKAISHKATLDTYRRDVQVNSAVISNKQQELKRLSELSRITKWSCNYLDELIKEESGKFIKRLNGILDYGVKTIFYDRNYSIEVRVSDNDKATIHLVYDDPDTGVKLEPDIKNCGGGIRTVVGSLAQIFFILFYHTEPILFVDEGFSQVSSQYIPGFFGLLHELAVKNNFRVLLITHDDRFLSYADRRYEVRDGHAVLINIGKSGDDVDSVELKS